MSTRTLLRSLFVLCAVTASLAQAEDVRTVAPASECMDARQIDRVYPISAWQLAVAQSDGLRFRVELEGACLAVLDPEARLSLLAEDGWACGGAREYVVDARSGEVCSIAALAPADEREFAALLRDAGRSDINRLAGVEVRARVPRGFRGTHDHCFAVRHVRAWTELDDALEVVVSSRRSGGNSKYRVELEGTCPDLGRARALIFHSGPHTGMVCGNTGDRVQLLTARDDTDEDIAGMGISRIGLNCAIREVFPIAQVAR